MYKEKIDQYIDDKQQEMLNDLMTLVRIDSTKGIASEGKPFGEGPAKVLEAAETLMKQYGLLTTNYDNYVVTGDFQEGEKELDILAHLDVVPVTDDWTVTQPFEPKIVDGKIYGRGTADDKGPAIAALYALRAIKELGIPLKKSVRLVLGSDEECGSSDLKYYYAKEEEANCTFTPDADFPLINIEKGRMEGHFHADFAEELILPGIVMLKSGDKANIVPQTAKMIVAGVDHAVLSQIASECSEETGVSFTISETDPVAGKTAYQIDIKGKAAHASTPQEGKNALTAAIRLAVKLPLAPSAGLQSLKALDECFPYEDTTGKALGVERVDPESGALTMCFSILDYRPDGVDGTFDSRVPIGGTEENTKMVIMKKLAAHQIKLKDEPMVLPHCVPGDSIFVKTLLESYERYTGIKGEPLSTGGGTYVHELKRGVAFGCMTPDVDNHMHGDDEFMVIERFLTSAKIFADAVIKLCNQ